MDKTEHSSNSSKNNNGSESDQELNSMMASIAPTPIDPSRIVVARSIDLADPNWISRSSLHDMTAFVDLMRRHVDEKDENVIQQECKSQDTGDATISSLVSPSLASSLPSSADAASSSAQSSSGPQFRPYQSEQWRQKYEELVEYKETYGDCLVPTRWSVNPALALWVKRMRRQYRIKHSQKENSKSTLTDKREAMLNEIGFVWRHRGSAWEENYAELSEFYEKHGHSVIARKLPAGSSLATWVKCQRRQYRLMQEGKQSSMTDERVARLERLNFVWEPRLQKEDENEQGLDQESLEMLLSGQQDDESALSFDSLSWGSDEDKKPAAK